VKIVANSVGYAFSSDLRVHFGLGDDRKASPEIHWPSGPQQTLDLPQVDRQLDHRGASIEVAASFRSAFWLGVLNRKSA
jgi:hypothetical protein